MPGLRAATGCAVLLCLVAGPAHAQQASALQPNAKQGSFEDLDGVERPFASTYQLYFGAARGRPHYIHAAAASAILLGIGTLLYWANPDANSADWELSNIAAKFKPSSIRFDDNKFSTNMFLHPLAGSGYYALARVEHITVPWGIVYTVTASSFWEFVLEWKEKVSINDLIMTPFGGVAMGEWMLRLNDYLNIGSPANSAAHRAARYSVGLGGFVHRTMHGEPMRENPLPNDELGFSSAYWHRFRVSHQIAYVDDDHGGKTSMQAVLAETELVGIPGFLRSGRFDLFFSEGNFTDARARFGFAPDTGLAEVDMWFHAALFGYYEQDFAHAPRRGRAMAWSATTSFEYRQRWLLGHRDDIALLHVPGPAWDVWLASDRLTFHGGIEASFDFGGVRPTAYGEWRDANPEETAKSVLEQYGYAFDIGLSTRARASLEYRGFELGERFGYGRYGSLEGLDRYEERITKATPSVDDLVSSESWLGYRPRHTPLEVRLSFEARLHHGTFAGFEAQRWERLASVETGLGF